MRDIVKFAGASNDDWSLVSLSRSGQPIQEWQIQAYLYPCGPSVLRFMAICASVPKRRQKRMTPAANLQTLLRHLLTVHDPCICQLSLSLSGSRALHGSTISMNKSAAQHGRLHKLSKVKLGASETVGHPHVMHERSSRDRSTKYPDAVRVRPTPRGSAGEETKKKKNTRGLDLITYLNSQLVVS